MCVSFIWYYFITKNIEEKYKTKKYKCLKRLLNTVSMPWDDLSKKLLKFALNKEVIENLSKIKSLIKL